MGVSMERMYKKGGMLYGVSMERMYKKGGMLFGSINGENV